MPQHVVANTLRRTEELDVAQLVDLVRPDRRELLVAEVPGDVSREAARNATPAPAYVILLVDANMIGRCGCPAADARERMSADFASSAVRWCSAYALSQKILKSGAAVGIDASRLATSCVTTDPAGLA